MTGLRTSVGAIAVLASAWLAWGAEPAAQVGAAASPLLAGVSAPGYAEAAAHDPRFKDQALWPGLTGQEYFLQESWPKARVYVWAHPGRSGGIKDDKRGRLDATDPANWLLDGKPATQLLLDEHADLVFPAAPTRYSVGFRGTSMREVCRHVTIGANASFSGGGDGVGRSIHGNVWLKRGGGMDSQGATRFLGNQHTFFRNDNPHQTKPVQTGDRGNGTMCSQYFTFDKHGKSVEFLGHVTVLDEFQVMASMVIVGRDSKLQPGRNASPRVKQGGVIALMDGAFFGNWANNFSTPDLVVEGVVQGGLPERPLTRSGTLGLTFKNFSGAQYDGAGAAKSWGKTDRYARVPSLVLQAGSALRSYSTDVAKARLTIAWQGEIGIVSVRPLPNSESEKAELSRNPGARERYAWAEKLPRGIDIWFASDVAVDGVEFDGLRAGGLLVQDLASPAKWQRVFYGAHCGATGEKLLTHVASLSRSGSY